MKHEPKKHFDVSKPRRHTPDPTSKPVIVGHHPTMPDPMIREEAAKAPKPISVVSKDADEPEPLTISQPDKPTIEPPKAPDLSDLSAPKDFSPPTIAATEPHPGPEPPVHSPISHTAPGAVFTPSAAPAPHDGSSTTVPAMPQPLPTPPAPVQPLTAATAPAPPPTLAEPPAGEELHIPAGHSVVHHKPRIWVWVIMAAIIVVWFYGAVDALTDVKLPFEFFKNSGN